MTAIPANSESATLPAWLVVAVLVGLQIHTTLPLGTVGVRLSLGDPMVVIALTAVMLWNPSVVLAALSGPARTVLVLAALASAWLGVAILHGRIEFGHWQSWAVFNRGFGWLLLLAYFTTGWIAGHCARTPDPPGVRAFLVFFWIGVIASAVLMVALSHRLFDLVPISEPDAKPWQQTLGLITGTSRFQGFVVNPNAFGLLGVAALAIHLSYIGSRRLFSAAADATGLALTLFGLAWTFSRGAWAGAVLVLGFLVLLRRMRYGLLVGAIAGAAALSVLVVWTSRSSPLPQVYYTLDDPVAMTGGVGSVNHRWTILLRALALWKEQPVIGAGAGAFLERQMPTATDPLATIHSTYIWLLAETGIVGLVLFAALFAVALRMLIRASRADGHNALAAAAAALVIAFAAEAAALEAMYQRHLWFFLGAGVAFAARCRPLDISRAEADSVPTARG